MEVASVPRPWLRLRASSGDRRAQAGLSPQETRPARARRSPSLARRLTLVGTALLALTVAAVAFWGWHTTARFLDERYREHLRVLAEYMALQVELGLLVNEPDMVRAAVSALPDRADLRAVTVLDAHGVVVWSHLRGPGGGPEALHWVDAPVWAREVSAPPGLDAEAVTRRIGTVRLGYSLEVLREVRRRLFGRLALFAAVAALLSVALYGALARNLTRPLGRLEAAAKEVSRGRLEVRAPEGGFRETDRVARMFNAMLDALAQREKDLEELNARLARREALAEVGRFSSMVAHEIKNPLTIIRGSLQTLRRPDPDGRSHATALQFMDEETARIDRLVGDFLLFAKPVTAAKTLGDWNRWLEAAVEKVRLLDAGGERVQVRRNAEAAAPGLFDSRLMETLLGHLVRNALDADAAGPVIVHSWVSPEGGPELPGEANSSSWWWLAVEDRGPGVPQEHREKIFEPFFSTKAKGSGLGLAMVRRIAEAHGGTVAWEPAPGGRGSRFVVRLPVKNS